MFINALQERNPLFIDSVLDLFNQGLIEPDSYVVDMDQLRKNAKEILKAADEVNITLYFMLKQLGRNPMIAQELINLGYKAAVVVDFREAEIMMENNIPLGNVGHLVQTPKHNIKRIMEYGTEVFTVFTYEKLLEINQCAQDLNKVQEVIVKIAGTHDYFYSGQEAGIEIDELESFIEDVKLLKNVRLVGATSFPCYLYDGKTEKLEKTPNNHTVLEAIEIMEKMGLEIKQINLPSTTSVKTLELMKGSKGTHGEPGHGLTGTTPAHVGEDLVEIPSVLYITEVSHNFRGHAYSYGGGHYRRSHVENALIYQTDGLRKAKVIPVDDDSIDYYFGLDTTYEVSAPVIMAFRFQIFVTRSKVVLLDHKQDRPKIIGVYDSLGRRLD